MQYRTCGGALLLACFLSTMQPARADLILSGSGPDQGTFVGLLNSYSTGVMWVGDGAGSLVPKDRDPALQNYFAKRLLELEDLDPVSKKITLNIGRNMPGVLIGAWRGGGLQDLDLADILVAKQTAQQEPIVALQGSLLLHEIWEVGVGVDLGTGLAPAHSAARSAENGELSSLGSRGQRRTGAAPPLKDLGGGVAELYVPWEEIPSTVNPPVRSMKLTFNYSGAAAPALTNLAPGYVGHGWEYDYSQRELQLKSLEASSFSIPEPGSLSLTLVAMVSVGFAVRKRRSNARAEDEDRSFKGASS